MIKNGIIFLFCSIIAKLLSYVWEAFIASHLGISESADAFYMATGILNILYPMIDLGIWKVFLPIYKQSISSNDYKKTDKIANISITLFLCLSVLLVIFFIFFADLLVAVMAPGFTIVKKTITVECLRIAALSYLLMAATTVISAMLQSHERFFGYQMREIINHVTKILYVYFCFDYLGIYAVASAIIVGGIFRFLIQLPFMNWTWNFKFDFRFLAPEIIPMLKGLPAVAFTTAITQINAMVGRMLASAATTGAVACLNYGNKLMNVFSGMVSGAIATVTYPKIIQYIAERKTSELRNLLSEVVTALSLIIIPISLFCSIYSKDLVQLAFQRGKFDTIAVQLTSSVFTGYCLGMLFVGLTTIITNVFYAFGDTRITLFISIIEVVCNIVLNYCLFPTYGVITVAYAASFSAILTFSIRMYFLKFYVKLNYKSIVEEICKIFIVSGLSVAISVLASQFIQSHVFYRLLCAVSVNLLVFLFLTHFLRIKAIIFVWNIVHNKIEKFTNRKRK